MLLFRVRYRHASGKGNMAPDQDRKANPGVRAVQSSTEKDGCPGSTHGRYGSVAGERCPGTRARHGVKSSPGWATVPGLDSTETWNQREAITSYPVLVFGFLPLARFATTVLTFLIPNSPSTVMITVSKMAGGSPVNRPEDGTRGVHDRLELLRVRDRPLLHPPTPGQAGDGKQQQDSHSSPPARTVHGLEGARGIYHHRTRAGRACSQRPRQPARAKGTRYVS